MRTSLPSPQIRPTRSPATISVTRRGRRLRARAVRRGDYEHEGQFATTPTDPDEAQSPADLDREADEAGGWADESNTTADSGYPRTDVYIDPDTGEEELDPAMDDNETLEDDVEDLINGTELEVRAVREGVVELSGRAATQEDLDESVREILGLDGVLDVDTTDVDVG